MKKYYGCLLVLCLMGPVFAKITGLDPGVVGRYIQQDINTNKSNSSKTKDDSPLITVVQPNANTNVTVNKSKKKPKKSVRTYEKRDLLR